MPDDKNFPNLPHRCSFCGKPAGQVRRLFSGHESFICNECVELCNDLLQSAPDQEQAKEIADLPTPADIKDFLDKYVIGQENAKKTVAVAVYNHYKRINSQLTTKFKGADGITDDVELEKSNILLMGPTGTGKTLIARSLAKFLKVPFTIADATVLTEAGYVGEDVENILVRLYHASNFNQQKTERGIIYIDEIDKISRAAGPVENIGRYGGQYPPQGGPQTPRAGFCADKHFQHSLYLRRCLRRSGKNHCPPAG